MKTRIIKQVVNSKGKITKDSEVLADDWMLDEALQWLGHIHDDVHVLVETLEETQKVYRKSLFRNFLIVVLVAIITNLLSWR